MLIGITLSAFGVSLSMKAGIGTSPTGVCPAVFSPALGITPGTGTGILFAFFLLVQIIILRKEFPIFQFLQLAIAALFGYLVDVTTAMIAGLPVAGLWLQALLCASGILTLAVGIYMVIKTDLLMLPPDAMITVIARKSKTSYSKIKIALDCTLTGVALIGTLLINGRLVNVGIGTVAAAIFIGMTIGKLNQSTIANRWMDRFLGTYQKGGWDGSTDGNLSAPPEDEHGTQREVRGDRAHRREIHAHTASASERRDVTDRAVQDTGA
ncbi:MAG: YczE/YyaS/YitT family protein [Christensenellales bacterium]